MPERITITVRPSGAHPDILKIEDAMRQVLDIFELLTSGAGEQPGVEWNLVSASTNSPLRIEAEAVSLAPSVDVTVIARAQKQHLSKTLRTIAAGQLPDDPEFRAPVARRILKRNLNGVGITEIDVGLDEPPIIVTPTVAKSAIRTLARKPLGSLYDFPTPRDEIGAVEGRLQDVGTHYNSAAVRIEARGHDLVWCRLSPELQKDFEDKATFNDVWRHRRVIVHGRIKYDADGDIDYIMADDILRIDDREIPLEAIRDTNFTGSLSIGEYLDRFREGMLG